MPTARDPLNLLLTQVERGAVAGARARVAYSGGADALGRAVRWELPAE